MSIAATAGSASRRAGGATVAPVATTGATKAKKCVVSKTQVGTNDSRIYVKELGEE